jgi:hypothetical protein
MSVRRSRRGRPGPRPRGIRADLELVLHQLLEAALVVDDEHEIDRLHADLRADAAAVDGQKRRDSTSRRSSCRAR